MEKMQNITWQLAFQLIEWLLVGGMLVSAITFSVAWFLAISGMLWTLVLIDEHAEKKYKLCQLAGVTDRGDGILGNQPFSG